MAVFTEREREVAELLSEWLTPDAKVRETLAVIGSELELSRHTVAVHVVKLRQKLRVRSVRDVPAAYAKEVVK